MTSLGVPEFWRFSGSLQGPGLWNFSQDTVSVSPGLSTVHRVEEALRRALQHKANLRISQGESKKKPKGGQEEARRGQEEARRGSEEARKRPEEAPKGQESRIWRKIARNATFYYQKMTSLRAPEFWRFWRIQEKAKKRPEEARKRPEDARKRPGEARNRPEEARKRPGEARKRPEQARQGPEEARKRPGRGPEEARKRPGRGQEEARKRPEYSKKGTKTPGIQNLAKHFPKRNVL